MRPSLRAYIITLSILTVLFAALTFKTVLDGSDDHSFTRALSVTSAVFIGPFTGAMSRDWQECCTEFSFLLLPYAVSILGAGIAAQFLPLPARAWARWLKLGLWSIGVAGWYATGLFSFLHALF